MMKIKIRSSLVIMTVFLLLVKQGSTSSVTLFDFPRIKPNTGDLSFERDAFPSNQGIELTKNQVDDNLIYSYGRASYKNPVQLFDPENPTRVANFITQFTFTIKELKRISMSADGLAFFLAPFNSSIAYNSTGKYLGLFNQPDPVTGQPDNRSIVAVEFDTYQNEFDTSSQHIGIDINSIMSVVSVPWTNGSMKDGRQANSWVRYNSASRNLSVYLTYDQNPVFSERYCILWYLVDLSLLLPERIMVGFTAATGTYVETHAVHSWSFNSTLELIQNRTTDSVPPSPGFFEAPQSTNNTNTNTTTTTNNNNNNNNKVLAIGLGVGFSIVIVSAVGLFFLVRSRIKTNAVESNDVEEEDEYDPSINQEFERGAGPKRFAYNELRLATRDFSDDGKLGEGGFGGVYRGLLSGWAGEVAVKRISKASSQGQKEYVSEVKIISRLRHRNLVQLIGWCHKQGEFLLVYEYLPNGSLDTHLFGRKVTMALPWSIRYKIGLGLASALLYLHEGWEQCVIHRDIKSSNVMLDANFNPKLGDFGLARLVDHEYSLHTVAFAGTMGYIAPESIETGKSSKESDVYSFGVVALEICCGRRSVVPNAAEPNKVKLVNWVWELYGKGQLLEAVDQRLNEELEAKEVECLMIVGLWCCHPDPNFRPTMKQVMNVLNLEAPLPNNLPRELPRPTYNSMTPLNMSLDSYTSVSVYTGSSYASSGSNTESSSKPLLTLSGY